MPTTIVPDRLVTKVRVTDTKLLSNFHIPDSTTTNDQYSYSDTLITVGNPYSVYGVVTDDIPAGLKTWGNFYNEVAVLHARIKVTPLSWRAGGTQPIQTSGAGMPYSICLVPIRPGNIISSSEIDFMEQPYARYKFFTQASPYLQLDTTGGTPFNMFSAQSGNSVERSVVNSMTAKKILSFKDIMDYDAFPQVWISTAVPQVTSPWGFVLTVKSGIPWNGQEADAPKYTLPNLYIRIDVTYTLMFRGRKTIADDV